MCRSAPLGILRRKAYSRGSPPRLCARSKFRDARASPELSAGDIVKLVVFHTVSDREGEHELLRRIRSHVKSDVPPVISLVALLAVSGFFSIADGSVMQFPGAGVREALKNSGNVTNVWRISLPE